MRDSKSVDSATPFRFSDVLDEDFFLRDWTHAVVHFPAPSSRFASLFGWCQFNTVLRLVHKALNPPSIKLVMNDRNIPEQAYCGEVSDRLGSHRREVSLRKVMDRCSEGATLIVNGIERFWPALQELAVELTAITGEGVHINAYCSGRAVPGFKTHFDTHEVFVLQVAGQKLWHHSTMTFQYPLSTQHSSTFPAPTEQMRTLLLREGEMLYIPRGAWHRAEASYGPSLHLSVGVHCRTRLDFLSWFVASLGTRADLRENLQRPYGHLDRDRLVELLRAALAQGLAGGSCLDEYVQASASDGKDTQLTAEFPIKQ